MNPPEQPVAELPSSTSLIITLSVVALISGLLVVLVYEYTKPIIAENQRIITERAIFKVLPNAVSRLTFRVKDKDLILSEDKTQGEPVYAGYDNSKNLVGLALPAASQGYQDTVRILYGYNPFTGCITGFEVLKSTETPGFGTKISSDPGFLANFNCLNGHVNDDLTALIHAIKTVRHGHKQHSWEIDAISGSTITSNAVGRMLNQTAQKLHPVIARHLKLLQQAGKNIPERGQ